MYLCVSGWELTKREDRKKDAEQLFWSLNCHFPHIPLSAALRDSHFPERLQNHPQRGQLLTFDKVNM